MRLISVLIATLLFAACSTENLIDKAFPGRERFAFRNSDGDSIYQYACESKGSEAATLANAKEAHAYTDRELDKIVDNAVVSTLSGVKSAQINREIDAGADRLIEAVETRYQCLAYDFRDA